MTMTKEQMAEQIKARKASQKDASKQVANKTTTNQGKQQNSTQDTTDTSKEIERLTKVNERQLKENQKLAEENERLHGKLNSTETPNSSVVEELHNLKHKNMVLQSNYEELETYSDEVEDDLDALVKDFEELKKQLETKTLAYETVTASFNAHNAEYTLLENQLNNATERIQQLKNYERDYNSLQVDHANLRSRYHSIENDLEEFKGTEALLVGTMERYVKLYSRVEGVSEC